MDFAHQNKDFQQMKDAPPHRTIHEFPPSKAGVGASLKSAAKCGNIR
jgi:hypothetical protein